MRSKTRKLLTEAWAIMQAGIADQERKIREAEAMLPLMRERLEDLRKSAADIEHDLEAGDPTRDADDAS